MKSFGFFVIALVCFQSFEANDGDSAEYLRTYGYLNTFGYADGNSLQSALQSYQNFAGLPVTGKLDSATRKQMTIPRCGNSDHRKNGYGPTGLTWTKDDLTYRFDNYSPDLSETTIRNVVGRAFNMWSFVTPLTFRHVSKYDKADIVISFEYGDHGDGSAFDGKGGTLAHATYPEDGSIHFDDAETYTDGVKTGTNLFWVAVHEIGHSLGLDHSTDKKAVMYPYYRSSDPDFNTLSYTDKKDIQSMYGGLPCKDRLTGCSYNKQIGHCTKYPEGMSIKCRKTCNYC